MADEIEIVACDPSWPRRFDKERVLLGRVLAAGRALATLVGPIQAVGYVNWAEIPTMRRIVDMAKVTGVVVRKETGHGKEGEVSVTTVALAIRAADGSHKTIIGRTWDYPELAVAEVGDTVTCSYGDIAGLTDFSIDWAYARK